MCFDYNYQKEIRKNTFLAYKGKIILPTGSGKGHICIDMIPEGIKDYGWKKIIVFSPRLILNKQWLKKLLDKDFKYLINFVLVGSDEVTKEIRREIEHSLYKKIGTGYTPPFSTLNYNDLKEGMEKFEREGYITIVISTYHSAGVVKNSGVIFDCAFYDEAHYLPVSSYTLVQRKKDNLFVATKIDSRRKYFLTATPKYTNCDESTGMNNEEVYGKEICNISPREMIENGYVLKPFLAIASINKDVEDIDIINDSDKVLSLNGNADENNFNIKAKAIFKAHKESKQWLKEESISPDKIGAKTLVVCNGSGDLRGTLESREFRIFREENPNIKIYTISCDTGIEINGVIYTRVDSRGKEEFLDDLKSLSDEEEAIILHVDMIGVGIDVPGITGVFFFRNCNLEKFLQNLGRGSRLHPEDRKRLESGELKVNDYKNYIKPGYIIFISYMSEGKENLFVEKREWILKLRSDYCFDGSSLINGENLKPAPTPIEDENGVLRTLGGITEEYEAFIQIEEMNEEIAKKEADIKDFINEVRELEEKNDEQEIIDLETELFS